MVSFFATLFFCNGRNGFENSTIVSYKIASKTVEMGSAHFAIYDLINSQRIYFKLRQLNTSAFPNHLSCHGK